MFTNADLCILVYRQGNLFILIVVYIDNFLFKSQSQNKLEWLKDQLMKEFNIKDLGKVKTIIGWEIMQNLKAQTMKINQKGYICNVLEAEGMSLCHLTMLLIKSNSAFFLD